jgi:hypothetical protein
MGHKKLMEEELYKNHTEFECNSIPGKGAGSKE